MEKYKKEKSNNKNNARYKGILLLMQSHPYIIFSRGILKIPHLSAFLPEYSIQVFSIFKNWKTTPDSVIGWGLRPTANKARAYAKKREIPYIALEDGFLRSLGLGVNGYPPFSLVCDDVGIYYDTTRPSRLEQLILNTTLTFDQQKEAEKALALIRQHRLSKYNQSLEISLKPTDKPVVLVIDQTFGDMAVKYGQADERHFQQMLDCAIAENPEAEIWLKTHPDVASGKKKGYFSHLSAKNSRLHLICEDVNSLSLLEKADKVYCVTSQMGFEALLLGKTVITFGVPWFAGWGLTEDRHPNAQTLSHSSRRKVRSVLHLFFCAYFQYSRYIDPYTGKPGTIFDVINYLTEMKKINQFLQGDIFVVGFSLWKRAVIKPFFHFPACRLHFISSLTKLEKIIKNKPCKSPKLLVWGEGKKEPLQFAEKYQLPVLRMEDGFIRSVGLGSNLVAPLSLVIDDIGIYFNSEKPSRLENILQTTIFSENDLKKAQSLHKKLIECHIGKYNVGATHFNLSIKNKRRILVVGQVEEDASIHYGSPKIRTNLTLLKTVRRNNSEAYIIYKPHPDIISKNRKGAIPDSEAMQFADTIVKEINILDCILQVDEVHTMTSLAGFEALLRNKIVHCYGLPFYSNWGLTVDHLQLPRRNRKLSLNELIAGTLLMYPLYIDPTNKQIIHAEQAIYLLHQKKEQLKNINIQRHWLSKQWEKLKQLYDSLNK